MSKIKIFKFEVDPLALYGAVISTVLLCLTIVGEVQKHKTLNCKTEIYSYKSEHGDSDTAVQINFQNPSSILKSIDDCTVVFLPTKSGQKISGRQAKFRKVVAEYPLDVQPYSSLHLFAFLADLRECYEHEYGATCTDVMPVAVRIEYSDQNKPIFKTFASYSPSSGLVPK